jgi:pimeloyl-ACP methyl ester carboxylesterase
MPFADAPGARLYYETVGSGTPIVFVHETCADLHGWEAQLRWFSRSHRFIAYNARGYLKSERGAQPETHDHLRLAEDIGVVMDAAGVERAFVVGFSMGAYVTAHFALAHPDRLLGLALAGLGAGSDEPEAFRAGVVQMAATIRREGIGPMVEQTARAPHRVQLLRKDPRGFAELLQRLRDFDAEAIANILQHCHGRRPPVYQFEAELRRLDVPTLIAVGDEDIGCMNPALFLKRTLPRAGLWVCPCTGHAINLEEPALFNATLQYFIETVQSGAWPPAQVSRA